MISLREPLQETRNGNSFRHAHEIQKPFGHLDHVIAWCKENLLDEWRWQLIQVSSDKSLGRYIFYFDSEREYLAFVMKWA